MSTAAPARRAIVACRVFADELEALLADEPAALPVAWLDQGLHNEPDRLRAAIQEAIDAVADDVDAVLLAYGSCGRGVAEIDARSASLVVPRASDCIAILLGSLERHRREALEQPTRYWYSTGWNRYGHQPSRHRLAMARARYAEEYGEEHADFLVEQMEGWVAHHNRASHLDTGVGDQEGAWAYAQACADELGWQAERLPATLAWLERLLRGPWDDDTFAVVPPGGRLIEVDGLPRAGPAI